MLKSVKACTIICDRCGKDFFEENDEVKYISPNQVYGWINKWSDWKSLGKKHYCDSCYDGCLLCNGNGIRGGISGKCPKCKGSGWIPKKG